MDSILANYIVSTCKVLELDNSTMVPWQRVLILRRYTRKIGNKGS